MRLTTLQENLAKGLSVVSRSVSTRAQLPILGNILLTTDKGRLKLSATNLETGINYWIGAKIEKEGTISIPAKVFLEFVSSLPAQKVELEVKENSLEVVCGSCQASFVGMPAAEFPPVPTLKAKEKYTFSSAEFCQSISQVAFSAATDEGRPVLTGVLLKIEDKDLLMVATDGYRLSLKRISGMKGLAEMEEFKKGLIIPSRTLTEVAKVAHSEEEGKTIGLSIDGESKQIIFSTPEAEIVSRLIEGEFPEFDKVIPDEEETTITLEKEDFIRSVRVAAIFARESANIVRLEIGQETLKVSANTAQVGSNVSEVEVKTKGKENQIAFNSRYLMEFLGSLGGERIVFKMTSALNPGLFALEGDKSFLHVIMPVRVQE